MDKPVSEGKALDQESNAKKKRSSSFSEYEKQILTGTKGPTKGETNPTGSPYH